MKKFEYVKIKKVRQWKKCACCDFHYKDEAMWLIFIKKWWIMTRKLYLCQSCASTIDKAIKWRIEVIKGSNNG